MGILTNKNQHRGPLEFSTCIGTNKITQWPSEYKGIIGSSPWCPRLAIGTNRNQRREPPWSSRRESGLIEISIGKPPEAPKVNITNASKAPWGSQWASKPIEIGIGSPPWAPS